MAPVERAQTARIDAAHADPIFQGDLVEIDRLRTLGQGAQKAAPQAETSAMHGVGFGAHTVR
jgi:hypothetical protein